MRGGFPALRAWQRRFLWGLGCGFLVSGLAVTGTSLGYFSGYQGMLLDVYLWARGGARAPEIVLVGIDDAAFQRLGERQPLPRDYVAGVLRGVRKSGARLIGLDLDLRQATTTREDAALAGALAGAPGDPAGPVVVARTLQAIRRADGDIRFAPQPLYASAIEAASGFAEVPKDDDGFFRRIPLLVPTQDGSVFPSLTLTLLTRLDGRDAPAWRGPADPPPSFVLNAPVWDEARGELRAGPALTFSPDSDWRINFVGPAGSFVTLSSDALHALGTADGPVAGDNPLRGRIVFVGATFEQSRDAFPTPQGVMYGVEIHANILHTLLTRSHIQAVAWGPSLAAQFAVCLAVALLFGLLPPVRALLCSIGLAGLGTLGLALQPILPGYYWIDLVTPILATWAGTRMHAIGERRRIQGSFHQYVGREVAERIYQDDRVLVGQRRTVSIMFTDLRDFTTLSEGLTPDQVADQLNEYFPMMVEAVQHYGGIVNDFIGDAVMAVYGAPMSDSEHARNAVRTALRMQAGLEALNAAWQARGLPLLRMGIGVHTGSVFAGNVGSPARLKYTVIGDAVNLAARVESVNKELKTTCLITESTRAAVGDGLRVRDCGEVTVKGRQQAVKLFELLAYEETAPDSTRRH
jgi:adenylate cyclase